MTARRLAWTAFGTALAMMAAGGALTWRLGFQMSAVESVSLDLAYATIGLIGALVASRHPRNPVGWMLLGVTLLISVSYLSGELLAFAVVERGLTFPGVGLVATLSPLGWGISGGLIVLVLHLFPDGKPLSARWAWVFRLGAFGLSSAALAILTSLETRLGGTQTGPMVANPLGQLVGSSVHGAVEFAALSIAPVVLLTPVVIFLRYRRSSGDARAQMKWLVYAFGLLLIGLPAFGMSATALGYDAGGAMFAIGITLLPASVGLAILKNRLYDIDIVISRTLVFAGLAGFITAIYVGIVVGVGTLLGAGGEPNLGLSIVATAVVAVAFQPARERLTRLANRLVFGRRATPYEVLSRFSEHLGEVAAPQQTLERMARLLVDGTGAARAQVWLRIGGRLEPVATWPAHMTDGSDPEHLVDVAHEGQTLGALSVDKQRGETLTPTDIALVDDLAAQAGLVLHNLRLTEELEQRIVDLQASRQRLVSAQDAERRRLERDLHDGAQRRLVELKTRLQTAKVTAEQEQAVKAGQVLDQLTGDADDAVATLRELAHGIYPPLLAAEGLAGALAAQTSKAAVPVVVEASGVGRYDQDVEAAVYFCVLEAINNAAKYADPTQVVVRLAETAGHLRFEVIDDGDGFDPEATPSGHGMTNMTDRLDALDGHLDIISRPDNGTRIVGRTPATRTQEVVQ